MYRAVSRWVMRIYGESYKAFDVIFFPPDLVLFLLRLGAADTSHSVPHGEPISPSPRHWCRCSGLCSPPALFSDMTLVLLSQQWGSEV